MDNQPIDLNNKIKYLSQQINTKHAHITNQNNFKLRLHFVEYIDLCIEGLKTIQNFKQGQKKDNSENNKKNSIVSKISMDNKLKALSNKQINLQFQTLRLQIDRTVLQKSKVERELMDRQAAIQKEKKAIQNQLQSTLQQLDNANSQIAVLKAQVHTLKEHRKKIQTELVELKSKINHEVDSKLQNRQEQLLTFKCVGIKKTMIYTNVSKKGQFQRYVTLNLPLKMKVLKLMYGIRVGIRTSNGQKVIYFQGIHFYEHEEMELQHKMSKLLVKYVKRNHSITCEDPTLKKAQIIMMLYGPGDSISIQQS